MIKSARQTKRIDITVVIPTYNERENIISLIPRIIESLSQLSGVKAEIIIIDDNSPDGTADVVRRQFGSMVRCIKRVKNRGLGTAIARGIRHARGSVIIGMDADGNHDPRYIPALYRALSYSDIAVGSRFVSGGSMPGRLRFGASLAFNACIRYGLGFPIWHNTSGFYAVSKRVLERLGITKIFYGYGEYHLRLVYRAHMARLRLTEIPIRYGLRSYGQSKSRLLIMAVTYLAAAIALRRTRYIS